MKARLVSDSEEIADLFETAPHTHLYGLADLDEPFWSRSDWYRRGDAVVGVVGLGDGFTTGYAMTAGRPAATLDLLASVQSAIPSRSPVVGTLGMSARLTSVRPHSPLGLHHRMMLKDLRAVSPRGAVTLTEEDLSALKALHASMGGEGFFLPAMLHGMPFMGIWEDDRLVASAGCHVVSVRHRVAAVGAVVTASDRRGQGLASAVTSALCESLVDEYEFIGLNVASTNRTAIGLYERLGFETALDYEELILS